MLLVLLIFLPPTLFAASPSEQKMFSQAHRAAQLAAIPEENRGSAIQLQSRVFLPSGKSSVASSSNEKLYLQFKQTLGVRERTDLINAGIIFHETVGAATYLATVPSSAVVELDNHSLFLGLEPVIPADKVPASIYFGKPGNYTIQSVSTRDVFIRFYADVFLQDALQILDDAGIEVPERDQFLFSNRLRVQAPADLLLELAESPMVREIFDVPPPSEPHNNIAAAANNVRALNYAPWSLTGNGINIGIWDDGAVRNDHFHMGTDRVIIKEFDMFCAVKKEQDPWFDDDPWDNTPKYRSNGKSCSPTNPCDAGTHCIPYGAHATHVAGTMVSKSAGLSGQGTGMAPSPLARLYSYNFFAGDDITEMTTSIKDDKILLSNHSYGFSWGDQPEIGGVYDFFAESYDKLVRDSGHIMVKSAGNDGAYRGYARLMRGANAKNIITVANHHDNPVYINSSSSEGPTKDGRIKPDVSANGTELLSAFPYPFLDSEQKMTGTSMAAPTLTGATALLVERWQYLHCGGGGAYPARPVPELVKALLVNAARPVSFNEDSHDFVLGPSHEHGHGSMDALTAVKLLEAPNLPTSAICSGTPPMYYRIGFIEEGELLRYNMVRPAVDANPGVKTTLAWTDLPGKNANAPRYCSLFEQKVQCTSDSTCQAIAPWAVCDLPCSSEPGTSTPCDLKNNLNSLMSSPLGIGSTPWVGPGVLDPFGVFNRNLGHVNHRDNIEAIYTATDEVGVFQFFVKGFTVEQGPQRFALVSNQPIFFFNPNDNFANAKELPDLVPRDIFDQNEGTGIASTSPIDNHVHCLSGEDPCPTNTYAHNQWNAVNFDATVEGTGSWTRPAPDMKHSVWFKWRAPQSGEMTFDTFGADFDTVLGAYVGSSLSNLVALAVNDDTDSPRDIEGGFTGNQSQVKFNVRPGVVYYILVGGRPRFGDQSAGVFPLNYYLKPGVVGTDVALTKTLDTAPPFLEGQTLQYTITVQNLGPNEATGLTVNDTGTNLVLGSVSVLPSAGCLKLPCTFPSLAAGATETLTLQARIADEGAFDNVASVSIDQNDLVPGNNTDNTGNGGQSTAPNTTVLNGNDSGPGSLRQIIEDCVPGNCQITFAQDIPNRTITLSSQISINKVVELRGGSIPGGIIIDGADSTRLFFVAQGANSHFFMRDLTLKRGNADAGAAVYNLGNLTILDSTLSGHHASGQGGAIYTGFGGSSSCRHCTLHGNSAYIGGAITANGGGYQRLTNVTMTDNTAAFLGGALFIGNSSSMDLEHVTISKNNAASYGGGISVSGILNIQHSIVASNQCTDCIVPATPDIEKQGPGFVVPAGINLIGINESVSTEFPWSPLAGTPALPLDPVLGPLQDNGGTTLTMKPLPGSPAIDQIPYANSSEIRDQRYVSRFDVPNDLGSVEVVDPILVFSVPVDLSIDKVLQTTGPYAQSQTIQYTLVVNNSGPGTATDVVVSDTPTNLQIDSVTSAPSGSCTTLPCTLPSMSLGQTETITVEASIISAGAFDNTATVTANEDDLDQIDNSDVSGNGGTAAPSADLSVSVNPLNPGPYAAGQVIQYTMFVENTGPVAASGIIISDVRSNLLVQSISSFPQGSCSSMPCNLASLAVGARETINMTAWISGDGAFDYSAAVSGNEADPFLDNNTDDSGNGGVAVSAADIGVTKTLDSAGPFISGQQVQYTLVVSNAGPNAASNVMVTDTPSNLAIGSVSSTQAGSCNALPCTLPSLAVGATETITMLANITDEGPFDNTATAIATELDPNPGNNSDLSGNSGITEVNTVVLVPDDDGPGSLRRIVEIAPAGSTITFDASLAGVPIVLTSGLISIDSELTIDASALPGGAVISAGLISRVLEVNTFDPVVLTHLTVTEGNASEGGGILNRGMLSLVNTTVSGNIAGLRGGGIFNDGSLTITNSTISGNEAYDHGAALHNSSVLGVVALTNSTISGNTSYGAGGGLSNTLGTISLDHVTIANNTAHGVGGGILNLGGILDVENTIIAANTSGGDGPDIASRDESTDGSFSEAVINTVGANLVGINDTVGLAFPEGPLAGTLIAPLDALLGSLGNNGGPTKTMVPLIGSLAIDAATSSTILIEDQRGQLRPFGPFSDIGAVEVDTETIFGNGFEQ